MAKLENVIHLPQFTRCTRNCYIGNPNCGGFTEIKSSLCCRQSQSKAVNKANMYGDDLTPFKAKDFFLFIEVVACILME